MTRFPVRAKHLDELAVKVHAARRGGAYVPDNEADDYVLEQIGVPVVRVDIGSFSDDDDGPDDVKRFHLTPGSLRRPEGASDDDFCLVRIEDVYVPAAAVEIRTLLGAVDDDDPSAWSGWQQALIRMHCGVDEPTPELLSRLTALRDAAARVSPRLRW